MTELKHLLPYLLLALTAYLLLLAALYFGQSRLLYYPNLPTRNLSVFPDAKGMRFESLELVTHDGVKLHGWWLPAQRERATLLFFHGNAGNISHRLESLQLFHELGMAVLIFDYRGYGKSAGTPSELGTYRDAEAAWRYLIENRAIPPGQIILFGRSLGGAIAAWLASRTNPAGVILESTFTSVPDLAAEIYPLLPARLLARFRYETLQQLGSITAPLLVVHSRDDEVVPFTHGERLYAQARPPKHFLEISGGHGDGFLTSRERYQAGLDAFINSLSIRR